LNRKGRHSAKDDEDAIRIPGPRPIHQDAIPIASTSNVTIDPLIAAAITTADSIIEPDDLSFLSDFANTDLASNAGDDVDMGGNAPISTEGDF